jgi:uncharacterized protein YgbK (DUF1537 family)
VPSLPSPGAARGAQTRLIGCIADDFTGGSDAAAALRRAGLRTTLFFEAPSEQMPEAEESDAVVVSLKIRTVQRDEAVSQALSAYEWLRRAGVQRFYYKYCSTFDSTDEGNIGPVGDALLDATGSPLAIVCPATPEHGRTMYKGHLFVGDRLLSESSMRDHPLTPMTDPDIVRVLSRQTARAVRGVYLPDITSGSDVLHRRLAELAEEAGPRGGGFAVVDSVTDDQLLQIASASAALPLLTGGAGLVGAMARLERDALRRTGAGPSPLPRGRTLVLAGSCSAATLAQVAYASELMRNYQLDPAATPDPEDMIRGALCWMDAQSGEDALLIYSSANAAQRAAQASAADDRLAEAIEDVHARLAVAAVARGVRRIVVAGGETSGAVVRGLGVRRASVGGEQARGVPWCRTTDGLEEGSELALLLKSGNFGERDLFAAAAARESA